MEPLRLAVLASGRGSNFEAILKNIQAGKLIATINVVISNKEHAGVLQVAHDHNIPAIYLSAKQFSDQEEFDEQLLKILSLYNANFVVLTGYLKMISPKVVRAYHNRMLNIHPALLPSFGGKGFYGIKVHEAVLEYGCKISGATVHLVDEAYDTGPPVIQRAVPVLDNDTPESLAARVLIVEHQIYSEALQLFAEGRVQVAGRKVIISSNDNYC